MVPLVVTIRSLTEPETDWAWAEDRLAGLRRLGLEPVAELLHHGFGPAGPQRDGERGGT